MEQASESSISLDTAQRMEEEAPRHETSADYARRLRCRLLHVGAIVIHAALVVVYTRGWLHKIAITIDFSQTYRLPTIVTVVSQTIGTVRIGHCYRHAILILSIACRYIQHRCCS